jgi:hypothetical protein
MYQQVVGRCSLCGGSVTIPTFYHSVVPPTPTCQSCGATKKNTMPIVEMEQPSKPQLLNERTWD